MFLSSNGAKFMIYQSETYRMIFTLFDLWGLNETQRLELLGISDIINFNDYQSGLPISGSLGVAEREGHLLAIHAYLRLLFPEQQELAYQWMSQQNKSFDGTPVAFVGLKGLSGLIDIRNYLSNICQC
jgi:hypothetical protein